MTWYLTKCIIIICCSIRLLERVCQEPSLLQVNDKIANTTSCDVQSLHRRTKSNNDLENQTDGVSRIIRRIPGNDRCAECGCPEPDWASLNLGILFCIQCSSAHRNLGVHVSKVIICVNVSRPCINRLLNMIYWPSLKNWYTEFFTTETGIRLARVIGPIVEPKTGNV